MLPSFFSLKDFSYSVAFVLFRSDVGSSYLILLDHRTDLDGVEDDSNRHPTYQTNVISPTFYAFLIDFEKNNFGKQIPASVN